jgi:4-alpha-glucanotransferase
LQSRGWLDQSELIPDPGFLSWRVDYDLVIRYRMDRLRRAGGRFFARPQGAAHTDFMEFCAQQSAWLPDYALFMSLAELAPGRDWSEWEPGLAQRAPKALRGARKLLKNEIHFWEFTQWCFFRQWAQLKNYCNERGIKVVGDLPIFVAYQSADVWAQQLLFELGPDLRPSVVSGVPPDFFSATGQRWGNPLYRWDAMEQQRYEWWIDRLRRVLVLVDVVRIDHFRGFAGYWEISASEATAVHGRWVPGPGEKLFHAIRNQLGPLPIIAEDLGFVTPDVTALREQFQLPGMRVLQFAFSGDPEHPFLPHNYEQNTVVYTGTHDNDTTLGWFASATAQERRFALQYLASDGGQIHWDMIRAAAQSVADLAIYPLQDVLGLGGEDRMNLPGQSSGYWQWRFNWAQVAPEHAPRLHELTALYGRCRADRLHFAAF